MLAIILPLNEVFFNFKQYDGLTRSARYIKGRKWLNGLMQSKFMKVVFTVLIVFPGAYAAMAFVVGPVKLVYWLKGRRAEGDRKLNALLKAMDKWRESLASKNVYTLIEPYKEQGFKLFVYYPESRIPKREDERRAFYERLEQMKVHLGLEVVFRANGKSDIDFAIGAFNIDVGRSFFFSDGAISPLEGGKWELG